MSICCFIIFTVFGLKDVFGSLSQSSVANGNPSTKTLSFGFNISFRKLDLVTCANSVESILHSN